jgi:DeoR family fructose operon transcriptional repressor
MSERRLKLASELIKKKKSLSVQDLMEHFEVSDMTIRRDLLKLEKTGEFRRFHGGVRYLNETPLDMRESHHGLEKRRIADYCLTLIQPFDTIILDSSTTTYQIAAAMADSQIRDITVITNSLNAAYQLRNMEHITLMMCGGEMRKTSKSFIGSISREFFKNINVNKAFISTGGITLKGFTTHNYAEAEIKHCMTQASEMTYILADSSKFDQRSLHLFAPLESANRIVTDNNLSDEWVQKIEKCGIELIKV